MHSVTRQQHPCPGNTRRWCRQFLVIYRCLDKGGGGGIGFQALNSWLDKRRDGPRCLRISRSPSFVCHRLHSGHFVKKTAGVSRGSLRVNVNEDIFLGYEMASSGLKIGYTEFLFYGKGRDAEFNAASVFLKKLAQV